MKLTAKQLARLRAVTPAEKAMARIFDFALSEAGWIPPSMRGPHLKPEALTKQRGIDQWIVEAATEAADEVAAIVRGRGRD
jgi:hypothetical protein